MTIFALFANTAHANNISVLNGSITGQSTTNSTCKVQFDISWENSWKNAINYDAAWVFIKYSTDAGTTWKHATLKANDTNPLDDDPSLGWSRGTNSDVAITVPTDKKGAFIQRTANGSGIFSSTVIKFVWDWSNDYLSNSDTVKISTGTSARVKIFAIEMIYIPQGAFSLGSGGSESGAFYKYPTTTNTYSVSSEAAINVGTTTDYLYYPNTSTYSGDQTGPIPAAFPKGYNAFYIMKYELSQGQYADFLNTLTSDQATARYPNYSDYRYTISGTHPNRSASVPNRACNYLSWADVAAYADWAGLRPFTELEFEKACRGTATAVANEYAWGNTTITPYSSISNDGAVNEVPATSGANCNYVDCSPDGPIRCGAFATSSSTRQQAGAGYYGVMELSGNVWERPVTVGNSTGRNFTGLHGDGALTTSSPYGNADVTNWPGTNAVGAGFRGGDWAHGATIGCVSDRDGAAYTDGTRYYIYGGRCARTAP